MIKKIHQIFITSDGGELPEPLLEKSTQLRHLYPDYEYNLWDNESITTFLCTHFNEDVIRAYSVMSSYAFKADLARYCILYIEGGLYFDISLCPLYKQEFTENLSIAKGISSKKLSFNKPLIENNFIACNLINHPFIFAALKRATDNIIRYKYGNHPLEITGPIMLGSLDTEDVNLLSVKIVDNLEHTIVNDKVFLPHKPKLTQSGFQHLRLNNTNSYEYMWFNNLLYNFTVSYIFITNNDKHKIVQQNAIKSAILNCMEDDEVIIIGDTTAVDEFENHPRVTIIRDVGLASSGNISKMRNVGAKLSRNNIVINADIDVMFSQRFRKKLFEYINSGNGFDTATTRIILPAGGRWWDRAVTKGGPQKDRITNNLAYEADDPDLFYVGTFIIRRDKVAKTILYDETLVIDDPERENEDIEISRRIKAAGYPIMVDVNNYVFHVDFDHASVINPAGNNVIVTNNDIHTQQKVIDNELSKDFLMWFKKLQRIKV